MTFWEKSGDEWDPTVPNTAELLEDWNVWFESIGKSQEKAIERLFFVMKEIRDEHHQPFRINKEEFMVGPPTYQLMDNGVFEKIIRMSNPIRKIDNQSLFSMCINGLSRQHGWYYGDLSLVAPAPGFRDDYLPWLEINNAKAFVALYTDHHSSRESELELCLFTTERVRKDALICPVCEKMYQKELAKIPSTYPFTRSQEERDLTRREKERFFVEHGPGKNYCNVRPGDLVMSRQINMHLFSEDGHKVKVSNIGYARRKINEWCAQTPHLYHVPTSHGLRQYDIGDIEHSAKIKDEILDFFTVRNQVGEEPDEDVAWGDITKAMVTRWRKALGLPAVRKAREKKAEEAP